MIPSQLDPVHQDWSRIWRNNTATKFSGEEEDFLL